MGDVYGALAPTFILIALGYIIRTAGVANAETFGMVNRFGYFVLYPAFLFTLVSGAHAAIAGAGLFILGLLLAVSALMSLAMAALLFMRNDGPAFTSVFQGGVRWNGFALLAAAPALYGQTGVDLIGLAFGPMVLFVNVICVAVLSRWGATRATSWRAVLDQIIANPLIIACAAGLAVNFLNVRRLGPISDALSLLGQAAMPIALLCVGAGLDFAALRAGSMRVAAATALKLLLAPLIFWGVARALGADPLVAAVAAGMGATPTAAAGYTLAREMGGDARLMAAIVTATTLASIITMPLAIGLAQP